LFNGIRCSVLDWIGHAEKSRRFAIDSNEHHRLSIGTRFFGFRDEVAGIDRELIEQRTIPQ
jgi:hypothetical protein